MSNLLLLSDLEVPKFTYCPDDIRATVSSATDTIKIVIWQEPRFSDNSGDVKLIYSSHQSPMKFPIGPNFIRYTIEDEANNKATCEFVIKVTRKLL